MALPVTQPPAQPFTFADLDAAPDDGRRREIIGGSLLVSPAPFGAPGVVGIVAGLDGHVHHGLMLAAAMARGQAACARTARELPEQPQLSPGDAVPAVNGSQSPGVKDASMFLDDRGASLMRWPGGRCL